MAKQKLVSQEEQKKDKTDDQDDLDDQEDDEVQAFNPVEKLQEYGININDIKKLKEAGYCTIKSLIMENKKRLCEIKGLGEAKIDKMVDAANKIEHAGFITGVQCLEKRRQVFHITTGSSKLDAILKGGIESQSITEVYGEFRTGKTNIAHTLCVTAQLSRRNNGGGGKVAYIDTEGTFRPEKICPIAERFGLDANEVLENIAWAKALSTEHMQTLLTSIAALMMESNYSLLIIDSIMALFRVDFSGRGELSERQQVLGKFISKVMKLSDQFNVAVFITNQVMADPGAAQMGGPPKPKPVGGHILGHASTTRLYLRKGKGDERVAKIVDSPYFGELDAAYEITDQGIMDAKE